MAKPISYPKESRGENFFKNDINIQRLLERLSPEMLKEHKKRLEDFGAWVGGPVDEQAAYSDRHAPPELVSHNKEGDKKHFIRFNPLYEQCHKEVYERGIIGLAFKEKDPAPHLLSFTMGYVLSQSDISVHCPVTMTGAVAYVLDKFAPDHIRDEFLPQLTSMKGDAKTGGTWATEINSGSDIAGSQTKVIRDGKKLKLEGLKWFTSNANSGLAVATARPEGAPEGNKGLGLYLVPSHLKDGTENNYSVRRLKDKLGTKALATGEIDLEGAEAFEIVPPPNGIKVMMEALEYSRIQNAMAAAGVQRRAFLEAVCWSTHREAFGQEIINYPMVQNEILDIMVRSEASTLLSFKAAKCFDEALEDETKRPWLRIATALAKYRTAEEAIQSAKKALELVGGNGYTEEWPTARQFRDSMVLTVWEGPANIQALELLRMVVGKLPGDQLFLDHVQEISDALPSGMAEEKKLLEKAIVESKRALSYLRENPEDGQRFARKLMHHLSSVLGAALLCEEAAQDIALGDVRKKIIAGRYLEKEFGEKTTGINQKIDIGQVLFDDLIKYKKISPEKLMSLPNLSKKAKKPSPPKP